MMRRYSLHIAAALLSVIYLVLGHLTFWPGSLHGNVPTWEWETPRVTSGDEPHYMVIIHSLLFDRDIHIENQHKNIKAGGYDAGGGFRGIDFGGHSLLIDRATSKRVICIEACKDEDYKKLGVPEAQTFQVPSHPIGYPLFMAVVLTPFFPRPDRVEALVGFWSIIIAILGVVLTYVAAIRSGLERRNAIGAALLLGFASSWIVYLRGYFSDPSIGLFLLLGYLSLRRGNYVRAGIAVGIAISMKSIYVLVGFAWILERVWARKWKDAFILTATVGVCGLMILASNLILLRTLFVPGALPLSFSSGFTSLKDTFVEHEHGLLNFVPWAFIPFIWAPFAGRPGAKDDHPGSATVDARRQMFLMIIFCVAVFAAVGFGPGWCNGPRYYVPLFPFLAILTMDFVASGRKWRAAVVGVLGLVGAVIAVPSVPQYHWLFSTEPFAAITGPYKK